MALAAEADAQRRPQETRTIRLPTDTTKLITVKEGGKLLPPRSILRFAKERQNQRLFRHFGRFKQGSELGQVQVLLEGTNATWYYNQFFSTTEAATNSIFRLYLRTNYNSNQAVTLPATATPVLGHVPGSGAIGQNVQGTTAHQLLLSMDEVSYSSRYGGTIVLSFRLADVPTPNHDQTHAENFAYEVRHAPGYSIDVGRLQMRVYVTPQLNLFNPVNAVSTSSAVAVEFDVPEATVYSAGVPVSEEDAKRIVREAFAALAGPIRTAIGTPTPGQFRASAPLFAHAFLHDQFQALIAGNEKVTKLLIADEFVDMYTEARQPYVYADWKKSGIYGHLDFPTLGDEFEMRVRVYYVDNDGNKKLASDRTKETDAYDDETVMLFGGLVSECRSINHIELRINLKELDTLGDDEYGAVVLDYVLNCDAIEARAALASPVGDVPNGIFGDDYAVDGAWVYGEAPVPEGDNDRAMDLTWRAKAFIVLR
jgi:hypothetical protein